MQAETCYRTLMAAKAAFIEPMLLLHTEKLPEGPEWLVELKSMVIAP